MFGVDVAFQRKNPAAIGVKANFPGFIEPALATSIEKVPGGERTASSATMKGTHWAIRPATKATSREKRSSLATTAFRCLRSCERCGQGGRRSSASLPFPVSASTYSAMISRDSLAAKPWMAARWASRPKPERCCLCVETLRYAIFPLPVQRAYRMACGRSGLSSNIIAVFMLQQHRPICLRSATTDVDPLSPDLSDTGLGANCRA